MPVLRLKTHFQLTSRIIHTKHHIIPNLTGTKDKSSFNGNRLSVVLRLELFLTSLCKFGKIGQTSLALYNFGGCIDFKMPLRL